MSDKLADKVRNDVEQELAKARAWRTGPTRTSADILAAEVVRLREQATALRTGYDLAEQVAKRAESAANTALGMCIARRPHDEIRDYLMSVGE